MTFVQVMELHTDNPEALFALESEWEKATEGKRTTRRVMVTRDRKDPQRHVVMAFFDSYESAMENSQLPETQEFAAKQATILSAPPVFHDLDVIDERS